MFKTPVIVENRFHHNIGLIFCGIIAKLTIQSKFIYIRIDFKNGSRGLDNGIGGLGRVFRGFDDGSGSLGRVFRGLDDDSGSLGRVIGSLDYGSRSLDFISRGLNFVNGSLNFISRSLHRLFTSIYSIIVLITCLLPIGIINLFKPLSKISFIIYNVKGIHFNIYFINFIKHKIGFLIFIILFKLKHQYWCVPNYFN